MKVDHSKTPAQKRKFRVRMKVRGTTARPRLHVFRSNQHIYIQVIDDQVAKTVCSANDAQKALKKAKGMTKTQSAEQVAEEVAKLLKQKKITQVVFDRGSYRYHGRVKAIAEKLREQGIQV